MMLISTMVVSKNASPCRDSYVATFSSPDDFTATCPCIK
jgi:hypothetical protein